MKDRTEELFGAPIAVYTRAQALEDGVLVDVSECVQPCPFKWPVAMTRAAYDATLAAGGKWKTLTRCAKCHRPMRGTTAYDGACACGGLIEAAGAELQLPAGQDSIGRCHDVFQMLLATMKNPRRNALQQQNTDNTRVYFSVLVDEHGNGHPRLVELVGVCGPGDDAKPVLTIMLPGED